MALNPVEFNRLKSSLTARLSQPTTVPEKSPDFLSRTKEHFGAGVQKFKDATTEFSAGRNPISVGLKGGAGILESAFSPVSAAVEPIIKPTLGKAMTAASEKISDIPAVQKFAQSKAGEVTSRVAEDVSNLSTIAGSYGGPKAVGKVSGVVGKAGTSALSKAEPLVSKSLKYGKNIAGDIVPGTERLVEHQISRALDLTPGDLSNISKATGNEVTKWIAENNLIGVNKNATKSMIDDFYKTNYREVRDMINKADELKPSTRTADEIPAYKQALSELNSQIKGVAGLEEVAKEVSTLMKKTRPTRADVQTTKELLDDHFSLYKVTGDVQSGVAKQGLSNLRDQLKTYLETEVKDATGADIGKLNNNVSTGRSIRDAIIKRSPKGLTRSNLKIGDLGIFGVGMAFGGPLVGAAALFGKKLLESPTVRLRIARYLDKVSDARKAKIIKELESGKIPEEFNQFIKRKNPGTSSSDKK